MVTRHYMRFRPYVLFIASCACLHGAVTITSVVPSLPSPQPLGTPITFNVTATDSSSGPLTFKFSTEFNGRGFSVVRNFNVGTLSTGIWSAEPFSWAQIASEGHYTIQVVAKDFTTGETATQSVPFTLTSIVKEGKITVVPTSNSLVALAGVPGCSVGRSVRVFFSPKGAHNPTVTPFTPCRGTLSSNFYLAGMYPTTPYTIGYEVKTGSTVTAGSSTATFTTGTLPTNFPFPTETVHQFPQPNADTAEKVVLHSFTDASPTAENYQPLATDLYGTAIWYYYGGPNSFPLLTRARNGGKFLLLEAGLYWPNGSSQEAQLVRLIDQTGNVLKETNIGLMSQQLLAMGATDLQSCGNIPIPVSVGASCMPGLTHDLIELPNGGFAALVYIEKIFPPGTQGNRSGLNVDIVGNGIVVLNPDLDVVWYWDAFQHDGGGTQLDINRAAILGETCSPTEGGARCDPLFLVGTPGVTVVANDWLHGNSVQYRSSDGNFIFSSRHQDWVMKIDFHNGAGTGNILWRMGVDGDFTFNNIENNPYPWFSGQHDAGFETNGLFDCFDNGDTRIAVEGPANSRGMVLNVDETAMTVTPVLSQQLGVYSLALGSAQLLSNGNYHFQPGVVKPNYYSYSIEVFPTSGTTNATPVYNLQSDFGSYRSFRMQDLYTAPTK
jgi:arylsulfate sulfotransferase